MQKSCFKSIYKSIKPFEQNTLGQRLDSEVNSSIAREIMHRSSSLLCMTGSKLMANQREG
ncbi:hypothetical protein OUZ56_004311 [Daphnia magna]|uniref:Uncharacterized protein n=1 Tax=Daphnia magna TaxID=35525 RepID=A0ABQ9YPI8_9CRUS|nr:hypothetical protein OUZ56_004311 [Daphnia magna]